MLQYGRCKSTGDFLSTGIQRLAVKQQLNKHYSQLFVNTYVCMYVCMYIYNTNYLWFCSVFRIDFLLYHYYHTNAVLLYTNTCIHMYALSYYTYITGERYWHFIDDTSLFLQYYILSKHLNLHNYCCNQRQKVYQSYSCIYHHLYLYQLCT